MKIVLAYFFFKLSIYFCVHELSEKPSISHLTVNSSGYNEGSRVNLQCGAKGKPEPDVRWIHDGYIKTSGTKRTVLMFSAINRTDAGSYTCSANNSVGSSEKQVDVVVNCKYLQWLLRQ